MRVFDQELYDRFKYAITETQPLTAQHKKAKQLLGDWLCAFQEVKMIEDAKRYAQENNVILVYRLPDNKFGFQLFADSPHRNASEVTEAKKEEVKQKKEEIQTSPLKILIRV